VLAQLLEEPCHVQELALKVVGKGLELALGGRNHLDASTGHADHLYILFDIKEADLNPQRRRPA
jgi:hypothetical protein